MSDVPFRGVTPKEFAETWAFSYQTVLKMCRKGSLPAVKIGTKWRISNFWERRLSWGITESQVGAYLSKNVSIKMDPFELFDLIAKLLLMRMKYSGTVPAGYDILVQKLESAISRLQESTKTFLSAEQLCEVAGISESTRKAWVRRGILPKTMKREGRKNSQKLNWKGYRKQVTLNRLRKFHSQTKRRISDGQKG